MNDLTGNLNVAPGVTAKASDLSLADTVNGTYVWTHLEECPLGAAVQDQDLLQPDNISGWWPATDGRYIS